MIEKYKTVYSYAEAEIIEKKSRFIAGVSPAETEGDAQAFIDMVRKKHFNARHNCYAFQAGDTVRCGDDGEPAGTAGAPILNAITGCGIRNCVIVVTRYFGGTLLGTGGLIRAYGAAAKEVLNKAEIIEKKPVKIVGVRTGYPLSKKVGHEILSSGNIIYQTNYTDSVEFIVLAEYSLYDDFVKIVNEATGAVAEIKMMKEGYYAVVNGNIEIFER